MSLLEKTKLLLRTYRIPPNKLLGQNFMIEPSIHPILADCISLDQDDVTLDVGAGFGFLTRFLAHKCKTVLAVEADRKLVSVLREQLRDLRNVKIVEGNVLKAQVPEFNKVASIPPYQISSRLITWLFTRTFERAVLIFQKEFAERLVASIGSENYGWLTILTYYYAECELLEEIPKSMFYPQPQVNSTIVRLNPKRPTAFPLDDETLFRKFVQSLFTHRNRKVRNAIQPFLQGILHKDSDQATAIVDELPFKDRRARELAPEDFGVLANALIK